MTLDALRASYAPGSDRLMWVALSRDDANLVAGGRPGAVAGRHRQRGGALEPVLARRPDHLRQALRRLRIALGWIDLTASPLVEQFLSTNIGDVGALFGDRRVLFVDHFNGQDGNGELVLVDRATGARKSLARSVTDVAVARTTDAGETDVAYAVRGRGSSSRDGCG